MKKLLFIVVVLLATASCRKCFICYTQGSTAANGQTVCFTSQEQKKQLDAIDSLPGKYSWNATNICEEPE